jgi:small-conductance mechanosensitive channel
MNAVLRVSLGNFLFFATFALTMIGVKDQNDQRDAWHHGGWIAKFAVWAVLVILMFFVPNVVVTIYGKLLLLFISYIVKFICIAMLILFMLSPVSVDVCAFPLSGSVGWLGVFSKYKEVVPTWQE